MPRLIALAVALVMLSACQPTPAPAAVPVTLPPTQAAVVLVTAAPATAAPTFTPTHTPTATPTASPTLTPSRTPTPTATLTPSITPTLAPFDFYAFRRPFDSSQIDYADRTYPYGMGELRGLPVHHGLDFANGRGAQILAIGNGTVFFAGQDLETLFGPIPDYYGNLVVIEHDIKTFDGQPVYSLYGHMQRIDVAAGERVQAGDRIGSVGDSGVAFGPHLHLEIRVGNPLDFGAGRNPDLWLMPYPGYGTLAGRLLYDDGTPVHEGTISVRRAGLSNAIERYAYSYNALQTINSDPLWRENFTLGDLPADRYEVFVNNRSGRVLARQEVVIEAGKTSFVELIIPR